MPTIGILYPGEMGAALGRVLAEDGLRVVSTVDGRSPRTRKLCQEAALEVLPSAAAVVRRADVIFSLVTPAAALEVAREFAASCKGSATPRIYVDANSVAPATAAAVGRVVKTTGACFADAAIHGLAAQLRQRGIVYLSGPAAADVANLLAWSLRVRVVGDRPGQASAVKGALAGMSKGLAALFTEIALLARKAGVSGPFLEGCGLFYPGVLQAVERLLPTYPRHAARREEEMAELERAMKALGLRPALVRGARVVIGAIADAALEAGPGEWTAAGVIEELFRRRALHRRRAARVGAAK
jgi:3-hydroxyisobutyrate dehydrogenase-like beta-hydroxyacid dehydrogenase